MSQNGGYMKNSEEDYKGSLPSWYAINSFIPFLNSGSLLASFISFINLLQDLAFIITFRQNQYLNFSERGEGYS